ncbi:hypothetical protein [Labrys monachus]|uniref:Uncharacterized protein n=1 Tax=Labrys monachus TaxID=217067 RepID=A0ABU0FNC3_9HYPH|nr:hypothetical protein [Labrys monachus]MDQ0394996.1 hypothetical protein [Labrys monachus]MDQ0396021.1 hypothetical protein [Labrys monachus]
MKTVLLSSLTAAALALSISSAFALSNSPEGQVIVGGNAPAITATSHDNAAPRHFLSGSQQTDPDFGLSSNAVEGRDFLNAQKGRY